ncbi:MAG: hypothetical protein A2W93_07950 [Bacteroidetes bacterium GWF2_43_63]|nr:MAG: hypothetical protein A2W94_04605 [Bacteroidetes bacterium GWE2_42_42]OFY55547.1 MAG: hypothetical protein A2W93_07950 [Bacteroidetes bacterium GWF2_43_63]HBG71558.1 hypothetical protein [Bacteroidales bacterium]HCB62091.1 hypothetical protein [Bacteroidales bacterium]HCY22319.1 hypothetical protein [Bacteroidales bacterium]
MEKINFKKWLPHILAIALFMLLSVIYFSPLVFDNKELPQGDVTSFTGMGKDLRDHHAKTGEYAHWSNAMFGGMPANYTYPAPMPNIFMTISKAFSFYIPQLHFAIVFLYLLGFYILLMSIGCKPWLSILGAIAYAFSSYNLIIIEAGHVNKALAMATMAPIIGGIIMTYRKQYLIGLLTTLVFTGVHIYYNHQQITYYLLLIIAIMFVTYFIYAIKEHALKHFLKISAMLIFVAGIAILPSMGKMITIMDYTKETMRGGAVLKNNPSGKQEGTGLDIDYAYQWSYGAGETWTLLIPNLYGGSSNYNIGTDSESYKALKGTGQGKNFTKYAPAYWGAQPFTSGPVYAGAIVCFLFVLGLIIVKGKEKWWLLSASILSVMLAWGKNLEGFNQFIFDNLPLYNKFRTPAMALIIAGVTMAILAVLAIKEMIEQLKDENKKDAILRKLYIAGGITGGLTLIFALFGGGLFNFSAAGDENYPEWLVDALRADRKAMMVADAWRSFAFIALAFGLMWAFLKYKFRANFLIIGLTALILVDLWVVDRRFLGYDNFIPKRKSNTYQMTEADKMILEDKDPNYRVLNLASSTFNESNTSYYHKSIGGYSPAKLRRYQDIIDYHFSKNVNVNVLNMLNTRYVIVPNRETGGTIVQKNPDALGNAWFVDTLKWVNSPDEEIVAITDFNPQTTAIIDQTWKEKLSKPESLQTTSDSTAAIVMMDYSPGAISYKTTNTKEQLAVFSEVFYKTWKATIDGKEVPIVRVNYILRGLQVPAGNHVIQFTCKDELYIKAQKISFWGSVIAGLTLISLIGLMIWKWIRRDKKTDELNKSIE